MIQKKSISILLVTSNKNQNHGNASEHITIDDLIEELSTFISFVCDCESGSLGSLGSLPIGHGSAILGDGSSSSLTGFHESFSHSSALASNLTCESIPTDLGCSSSDVSLPSSFDIPLLHSRSGSVSSIYNMSFLGSSALLEDFSLLFSLL